MIKVMVINSSPSRAQSIDRSVVYSLQLAINFSHDIITLTKYELYGNIII